MRLMPRKTKCGICMAGRGSYAGVEWSKGSFFNIETGAMFFR